MVFEWPTFIEQGPQHAKQETPSVAGGERAIAVQLLAASEGLISTATAMKHVGFKSPERDETRKKKEGRKAQKIKFRVDPLRHTVASPARASTPHQLVMEPDELSKGHSVSSLSATPSNSPSAGATPAPPTEEQNVLIRQLEAACDAKPPPRKHGRLSAQNLQPKRAGMNSVELEKHFNASILPLDPDIEDMPLKRVIAKLDSGPSRMNVQMLAHLRLRGLHVVPGLPNSTGKTQETVQNCGPFMGCYRTNLHTPSGERFEVKKNVNVTDLPFLAFGGKDTETGIKLFDAFNKSFSATNCLSAWPKCGDVPLARTPMEDKGMRHELVLNEISL